MNQGVKILAKKEAVNITAKSNGGSIFECRVGWDVQKIAGRDTDIDITAIAMKGNDSLFAVYYGNLKESGVSHSGDNRTGEGEGWDETITIDTKQLPADCDRIAILALIYNPTSVTFGDVRNVKAQIYDVQGKQDIASYMPELEAGNARGLVLGEFIKNGNDFYFKASGDAYAKYTDAYAKYNVTWEASIQG